MGKRERQRETDWECSKALTWCSFSLISCWRDRVVACLMENSAASTINRWLVSIMLVRTSFNWRNTHRHTHTRGSLSKKLPKYINFIVNYEKKYWHIRPNFFFVIFITYFWYFLPLELVSSLFSSLFPCEWPPNCLISPDSYMIRDCNTVCSFRSCLVACAGITAGWGSKDKVEGLGTGNARWTP